MKQLMTESNYDVEYYNKEIYNCEFFRNFSKSIDKHLFLL